jgi:SHS2 domain-containing protein
MNDMFIKVYPNAVTDEFCDRVIAHFERMLSEGRTLNRQQHEGALKINKDDEKYFFENEVNHFIVDVNSNILKEFNQSIRVNFSSYSNEIGILNSLATQAVSESIKIQKTEPRQGYHVWHCEHANISTARRLAFVLVYLNDIEDGGETEFLYQSLRIPPKKGTMIIAPASYTHTHRGNPPLSETKYIISTWIELIE